MSKNWDLAKAAQSGNLPEVQRLCAQLSVNQRIRKGKTPLHYAAMGGQLAAVDFLLSQQAEVNPIDNYGSTPLNLALKKGHAHVVSRLGKAGALSGEAVSLRGALLRQDLGAVQRRLKTAGEVNKLDEGQYPLSLALQTRKGPILDAVLAAGPDIARIEQGGGSVLRQAVDLGWNCQALEALLKHGAKLAGSSALASAAAWHHNAALVFLLEHGAQVNDANGRSSAVYSARQCRNWTGLKILVEHGANYKLSDLGLLGDDARLAQVLDQGRDINEVDEEGDTALFGAAWRGHTSTVRLLLSRGADPNIAGHDDNTALHQAIRGGESGKRLQPPFVEIMQLLLESGANPNAATAVSSSGYGLDSPLHTLADLAHGNGDEAKMRVAFGLLLKYGANPRHKDAKGRDVAAELSFWDRSDLIPLLKLPAERFQIGLREPAQLQEQLELPCLVFVEGAEQARQLHELLKTRSLPVREFPDVVRPTAMLLTLNGDELFVATLTSQTLETLRAKFRSPSRE